MTQDDGRTSSLLPRSLPPISETADIAWDDDTVPRLDDPALDRVTAVPELPPELLAQRLMAEAREEEPVSGTFERSEAESSAETTAPTRPAPAEIPPLTTQAAPGPCLELDFSALSQKPAPPSSGRGPRELADRYAMGDYSGALVVAEGMLDSDPGNVEALRYAKNCRDVLTQMYSARLGSLDQVVSVGIPGDQIRWLSLDHRAGFLLSLVDGTSSLEEILDISGMPRLDALRIMFSLLEERVITLRPRA